MTTMRRQAKRWPHSPRSNRREYYYRRLVRLKRNRILRPRLVNEPSTAEATQGNAAEVVEALQSINGTGDEDELACRSHAHGALMPGHRLYNCAPVDRCLSSRSMMQTAGRTDATFAGAPCASALCRRAARP